MYDRIKQLCNEHHITVAELERSCGLSPSTIRKWDGNLGPTVTNVNKVADYFNVSMDYLCERSSIREIADNAIGENVKTFYRAYENIPINERGPLDAVMDGVVAKYSGK